MTYVQINGQSEKDLLTMESIAIPLSFLVLPGVRRADGHGAAGRRRVRDSRIDGGAAGHHVGHRRARG
jgi:hypothetical protein